MSITHTLKAVPAGGQLAREEQLAWKIAQVAANAHKVSLDADVKDMVINRIIDNAAIALAAIHEYPIQVARAKAWPTRGCGRATLYGVANETFDVARAAFHNAAAVRFRDQDDTYLAAEYSHPDDNISPIIAVAQQMGRSGADVMHAVAVAYEIHVALVGTGGGTGICLHKHKVDHMTHIAAASAAGIGALLNLSAQQIYHAVNFAVHNAVSSRQSRKGEIGAQKEFVPGYSAEIAIEAVHNAMLGLIGPNPVYEGEDSIIRRFLNGRDNPDAVYTVRLPEPGHDTFRNIMMTYPKEHAFEYQGQAIIDAVLEVKNQIPDISKIQKIILETSHHTHHVIGTDAGDPQKVDPNAPRGTLDHSIMFAIARALQLGRWDEDVYDIPEHEKEPLRELMLKVETRFDAEWERKYHSTEPAQQAMGGKLIFEMEGDMIKAEGRILSPLHQSGQGGHDTSPRDIIMSPGRIEITKERANAHCYGAAPWGRKNYIGKFEKLTRGRVSADGAQTFFAAADNLEKLTAPQLCLLLPPLDGAAITSPGLKGIY